MITIHPRISGLSCMEGQFIGPRYAAIKRRLKRVNRRHLRRVIAAETQAELHDDAPPPIADRFRIAVITRDGVALHR